MLLRWTCLVANEPRQDVKCSYSSDYCQCGIMYHVAISLCMCMQCVLGCVCCGVCAVGCVLWGCVLSVCAVGCVLRGV